MFWHELTSMVCWMSELTLSSDRTSTWTGCASPPACRISWLTVVMVDSLDLGSGMAVIGLDGSLMVLAATTTFCEVEPRQ